MSLPMKSWPSWCHVVEDRMLGQYRVTVRVRGEEKRYTLPIQATYEEVVAVVTVGKKFLDERAKVADAVAAALTSKNSSGI